MIATSDHEFGLENYMSCKNSARLCFWAVIIFENCTKLCVSLWRIENYVNLFTRAVEG